MAGQRSKATVPKTSAHGGLASPGNVGYANQHFVF